MAGGNEQAGRLSGTKSASYVRTVNVPEARASRFTARYMLASDVAYVLSAGELELTPAASARSLIAALLKLLDALDQRDTSLPPGDIVSQREAWVRDVVGASDAAWLHLGRNRGESLRCYLPRLHFRHSLWEQRQAVCALVSACLARAETTLTAIAPNYHHMQHSGFTTLGEYLLSWGLTFGRHLDRIAEADGRLDLGPPIFGSRSQTRDLYDRVARRLGFTQCARVRRDGIWIQDQFTEPFFVHTLIGADLARLAQDLRLWMTPEFALFDLADEHAGGSSALPHAKVPFGLQAVIGTSVVASSRLAGELAAASGPSEGSEPLYQSASLYSLSGDIVAATGYMADVVAKGRFDLAEMDRKARLDFAGSSEAHDRLTYDFGVPFRAGHHILGAMSRAIHLGEQPPDLQQAIAAETGRAVDISQAEIVDIMMGKRIWPTTFDFDGLRTLHSELAAKAASAQAASLGPSPVERSIEALLSEAAAWRTEAGA